MEILILNFFKNCGILKNLFKNKDSHITRQYFIPENQTLMCIFGGFSGLSLSFIPFIIPSFAPVLPQVVSSYARNFRVKNELLDDI